MANKIEAKTYGFRLSGQDLRDFEAQCKKEKRAPGSLAKIYIMERIKRVKAANKTKKGVGDGND